jgi:cell division protein DivIC
MMVEFQVQNVELKTLFDILHLTLDNPFCIARATPLTSETPMQFFRRFRFLKNFYLASSVGLLVWLLFFEMNGIPDQIKNWWKLQQLDKQKEYYVEQIDLLKKEQASTLGTEKLMEKYAREKYFMKKDSEDVFVLVDKNGEAFEK